MDEPLRGPAGMLCPACGYDVAGISVCPECGRGVTPGDFACHEARAVLGTWRAERLRLHAAGWGVALVAISLGAGAVASSGGAAALAFIAAAALIGGSAAAGYIVAGLDPPSLREARRLIWVRHLGLLHGPWLAIPVYTAAALTAGLLDRSLLSGGVLVLTIGTVGFLAWVLFSICCFAYWADCTLNDLERAGLGGSVLAAMLALIIAGAASVFGFLGGVLATARALALGDGIPF